MNPKALARDRMVTSAWVGILIVGGFARHMVPPVVYGIWMFGCLLLAIAGMYIGRGQGFE